MDGEMPNLFRIVRVAVKSVELYKLQGIALPGLELCGIPPYRYGVIRDNAY